MGYPTAVATDAELFVAINNLSAILTGAIDATQTGGITLDDASSFPSAGFVTIDLEVIQYTSISTNTLAGVTRGADGTTGAAHLINVPVEHFSVAGHHNALKDELQAVETELIEHFDLTGAVNKPLTQLQVIDGTLGAPPYSFASDPNSGVRTGGSDIVQVVVGGIAKLSLSLSEATFVDPILAPVGAVGAPGLSFDGDADSGLFRSAVNTVILATGGVASIAANADGAITQSRQPSFLATVSGAISSNVTGDGTVWTIEYDTEIFDQSADYNTGTYTFTAPVTGRYLFTALANMDGFSAHTRTDITLVTSNRSYVTTDEDTAFTGKHMTLSVIADMDAGDTASVTIASQGGAKQAESSVNPDRSSFSGSLIN